MMETWLKLLKAIAGTVSTLVFIYLTGLVFPFVNLIPINCIFKIWVTFYTGSVDYLRCSVMLIPFISCETKLRE